jgi:hypothetical protein
MVLHYRWGSSFSNKYFLEKRFVVKHIFNKHQQRLDEQRDVIRDELYWLAYEMAKKSQHAATRTAEKQKEKEAAAAAVAAAAGDAHLAEVRWLSDDTGEGGRDGGAVLLHACPWQVPGCWFLHSCVWQQHGPVCDG